MRTLLLIPVLMVLVVGCGLVLCRAMGIVVSATDVATAVVGTFAASLAGSAPLWLTRGADQRAVAQAALVAITVHLFVSLVTAAAVYMLKLVSATPAMTYWLMALYWATLAGLAMTATRLMRRAPPAAGQRS